MGLISGQHLDDLTLKYVVEREIDNADLAPQSEVDALRTAVTALDTNKAEADASNITASTWLTALGLDSVTTSTTISNIATAESGFTINNASYAQWGKIAMIYINVAKSTAVTSNSNIKIAVLVSGKRPAVNAMGEVTSSTISHGYVTPSGELYAYGTWAANASKSFYSIFLLE